MRRLVWLLAIGVAQILLATAAMESCVLESRSGGFGLCMGRTCGGYDHFFRGYPVPWEESKQGWSHRTRHRSEIRYRAKEFVGRNVALPPLLFLIAVCLPPVAFDVLAGLLRRIRGFSRHPLSRVRRLLRVSLFSSLAGLFIVTCLWELEGHYFHGETPWKTYPPGVWVSETKDHERFESGLLEMKGKVYHWLWNNLTLDLRPQETWPARTRRTLIAISTATLLGCVLFRPWRRPATPVSGPAGPPPCPSEAA
jgi:hypothetical protein